MVHTYRLTIVTDQPLVDGHVLRDAIGVEACKNIDR